jgi:sugar phosphate isomerase/epimerase
MNIGYQAVFDENYFDALNYAAQYGFQYVQFDLNVPRFYLDQLDEGALRNIRKAAEKNGVGISFHAPGDNVSLFSDYPLIRQGIMNHFSIILEKAGLLGARHVTVHPGNFPSFKKSGINEDDFMKQYRDYFSEILYQNLRRLADTSDDTLLCVENFKFTDLTMDVLEKPFAEGSPIFLTWDLAKTYDADLNRNEKVENFMRKHENRIREVHVHDVKKRFRSHQTIGTGDLDFKQYHDILMRGDIAVTIEVRPREEACISRKILNELIDAR